jgi:hypothetical protein
MVAPRLSAADASVKVQREDQNDESKHAQRNVLHHPPGEKKGCKINPAHLWKRRGLKEANQPSGAFFLADFPNVWHYAKANVFSRHKDRAVVPAKTIPAAIFSTVRHVIAQCDAFAGEEISRQTARGKSLPISSK